MVRGGCDGYPVLDGAVGRLQARHEVDLCPRHARGLAPYYRDVHQAVSCWQAMECPSRPVRSQRHPAGCEASCQDRLLVRLPGASDPVDALVDSLPGTCLQPCPDGSVRQAGGKCLCPCKQAMLFLRKRIYVLHTSIKARTTDIRAGISEVS